MNIQQNVDLTQYNSFNVSCSCKYYAKITNLAELSQALEFAQQQDLEFLVLGGGSNILVTADYQGLILHIKNRGIETLSEAGSEDVLIKIAAGENWHYLVNHCLQQGFHGLENLALIPGTVGAAPIQNIGAYGVELKQFLRQLTVYNIEQNSVIEMDNGSCNFAYRDSVFKRELHNRVVILDITLQLSRSARPNTRYQALQQELEQQLGAGAAGSASAQQVFDAVCRIRRSKLPDPAALGNAGSFFKNPVVSSRRYQQLRKDFPELPVYPTSEADKLKVPAAWLLEQAGWKGRQRGDVGVHKDQALVIVNYGQGTGTELLSLAQDMQLSVAEQFQIELEMEVRII